MILGRVIVIVTAFTVGLQVFNVYRRHGPVPLTQLFAQSARKSMSLRLDHLPMKGERASKVFV